MGGATTLDLSPYDNSGNIAYNGDITKGIFIWGMQFEQGSFASSYIPTTTTTLARASTLYQDTTAGRYATDNLSIDLVCDLYGAGQTGVLWGSYTNADNMVQVLLNPNDITLRKEVATVVTDLVFAFVHGVAPFRVLAKQLPTGMSLQVALIGAAEPAADTNANTTGLVMAADFEVMSDGNDANHATGGAVSAQMNDKELAW